MAECKRATESRGRLNCGCRTSGSTKAGVLSAVLVCAGTAPSSTMPIKTTPSALTERMAGRSTNTERNGLHVLLHEIQWFFFHAHSGRHQKSQRFTPKSNSRVSSGNCEAEFGQSPAKVAICIGNCEAEFGQSPAKVAICKHQQKSQRFSPKVH